MQKLNLKLLVLGFVTVFSPMAWAILNTPTLFVAADADQKFFLENTIRLIYVHEDGSQEFFCTGVVTNPREIMTAGHCLRPYPGSTEMNMKRSYVFAEIPDAKGFRGVRRVGLDWAAIRYDIRTDLGLVRLESDIREGGSIPLLSGECDDPADQVLAGYGMTEEGTFPSKVRLGRMTRDSKELLKAFLDVQPVDVRMSPDFKRLLHQKKGKACYGDSGAPIFCKSGGLWALAGLMSSIEGASSAVNDGSTDFCEGKSHVVTTSISDSASLIAEMRLKLPVGPDEEIPVSVEEAIGLAPQ